MAFNGYNNYNYGNTNPYMNQRDSAQNYYANTMNSNGYAGYVQSYQNPQSYQMGGTSPMPQQQSMQGGYQGNGYSSDGSSMNTFGAGKPIWVHGEMEARMYPSREPVWLMDSSSMTCYFKTPDLPDIKIYDMVERQPGVVQTQYPQISMDNSDMNQQTQDRDTNTYATWDAFHNLENKVNEMMESRTVMSAQTNTGNANSGKRGNNNA